MKIIGNKLINEREVPIVVECMSLEVEGHRGYGREFDPDNCRVYMRGYHPAVWFFIIKTERYTVGHSTVKPYKWLTQSEAESIMNRAAESDVIDLRKLGSYQICSEERIQTVFIRNDIDDWNDEDVPIMVKIVDDKD